MSGVPRGLHRDRRLGRTQPGEASPPAILVGETRWRGVRGDVPAVMTRAAACRRLRILVSRRAARPRGDGARCGSSPAQGRDGEPDRGVLGRSKSDEPTRAPLPSRKPEHGASRRSGSRTSAAVVQVAQREGSRPRRSRVRTIRLAVVITSAMPQDSGAALIKRLRAPGGSLRCLSRTIGRVGR